MQCTAEKRVTEAAPQKLPDSGNRGSQTVGVQISISYILLCHFSGIQSPVARPTNAVLLGLSGVHFHIMKWWDCHSRPLHTAVSGCRRRPCYMEISVRPEPRCHVIFGPKTLTEKAARVCLIIERWRAARGSSKWTRSVASAVNRSEGTSQLLARPGPVFPGSMERDRANGPAAASLQFITIAPRPSKTVRFANVSCFARPRGRMSA